MTRRIALVGALVLGVLAVSVGLEALGPGAVNPERDIAVTLVTTMALLVVAFAFEPAPVPHPLLGSLLVSALVLFPPLDSGLMVGAVIAISAYRAPGARHTHPLAEGAAATLLTIAAAWLLQLLLGGPLLTTGVFPQPGQGTMPGLLGLIGLGIAWWLAIVTLSRLAMDRTGGAQAHTVSSPNSSTALALGAAGIGFATAFWSVLATIATNAVVGATVLAFTVAFLAISHNVERRRIVAERDLALQLSQTRGEHLAEAVARADQALVDLFAGIHDGPLQEFSAAAAFADLASGEPGADERWIRQRDILQHGVAELRALLRREAILEASSFATIDDAVGHVRRIAPDGLPEEVVISAPPGIWDSLDDRTRLAMTLVAQESLLNAAKHAQASCVTVRLERSDIATAMTIEDDGQGFAPDAPGEERGDVHLGQTLMALRMARVGGDLTTASTPGRGTTVTATAPVRAVRTQG